MPKFDLYSIRDRKSDFWTPRPFQNEKVAVRDFTGIVKSGEGVISDFPDDFSLYLIGTYDSSTGVIDALKTPKFIISADVLKDVKVYEE